MATADDAETTPPPRKRAPRKAAAKKATPRKRAPRKAAAPEAVEELPQTAPEPAPEEPVDKIGQEPVDDEGVPLVSKELTVRGSGGVLRLAPFQRDLDSDQKAALVSIGIDPDNDKGVIPYIRPFVHLCQSRGLDPWQRDAYLIGRGQGDSRRWTLQVGIDGYLKMAKATGNYRRLVARLWAKAGDDDFTPDSMGVMRKTWYDHWPTSWGHPAAAKVVIEHYDDHGNITFTEAQADWDLYAPLFPAYEDDPTRAPRNGKPYRRKKRNPETGEVVMELGEFWAKGGAHMLAKCALALAIRMAFPGATAGTLTTEEMHQADALEARRRESDRMGAIMRVASERHDAEAGHTGQRQQEQAPAPDLESDVVGVRSAPMAPPPDEETTVPEPVILGQQKPARPAAISDDWRRQYLIEELGMMAEILDTTEGALTRRWAIGTKKNYDDPDVPVIKLQQLVSSLRPMVIAEHRYRGHVEEADAWERVGPQDAGARDYLLGKTANVDGSPMPEPDQEPIEGVIVGHE